MSIEFVLEIISGQLSRIQRNQRKFKEFVMQEFDDLKTAVATLIADDEAETTLLKAVKAQLDALLANPQGVSPTEVTALRDAVAAEIAKVEAATAAAGGTGGAGGTFTVGGNVSGLAAGDSVELLNNGGDALDVISNGPFTFATALKNGAAYAVTVGTQPTGVALGVTNDTGTILSANVTNVTVAPGAVAAAARRR